ncbi:hypothetical protein JNK13_10570 [bacterium]|nr:hypothetical protein [bacterium]
MQQVYRKIVILSALIMPVFSARAEESCIMKVVYTEGAATDGHDHQSMDDCKFAEAADFDSTQKNAEAKFWKIFRDQLKGDPEAMRRLCFGPQPPANGTATFQSAQTTDKVFSGCAGEKFTTRFTYSGYSVLRCCVPVEECKAQSARDF